MNPGCESDHLHWSVTAWTAAKNNNSNNDIDNLCSCLSESKALYALRHERDVTFGFFSEQLQTTAAITYTKSS